MGNGTGSKGPRRRIDGAAKARFVEALRAGVARDVAAGAEGFSAEAFYCARKRDPLFRAAWIWAMELSAADEREARRAGALREAAAEGPIQANNRRVHQRRRKRGIEFTDARKQLFLDHFAGTADMLAACDAAGIHYSTAYKHRRTDPQFAAGWDEALTAAYALLEAEALRQRLEAQRRAAFEPQPAGEMAQEFDRVLKLLARLDPGSRRGGAAGGASARQRRSSFDDTIRRLDRSLRALGARHGVELPDEPEEPEEPEG
jgi:hypothetical protein